MSKPEYLSRDLSFLSFNRRVLDETKKDIPLADRVMFFGIAGGSNLDEFLNVRYPACLAFQSDEENEKLMDGIKKFYLDAVTRFETFNKKHKIVRSVKSLDKDDRKWADKYFKQNVYPALQTITFERGRTLNLHSGFYVLVLYEHHDDEMAGYIEIPKGINRFIQIPGKKFVIGVEDLIKANIKMMFLNSHEYTVAPFVISRSAEVFVQTDQYTDPLKFIQNTLREREQSWITYLEIGSENKRVLKILRKCLPLSTNTITLISPYVHLMDLKKIPKGVFDITEQARKYEPIVTFPQENLFGYIRKEDRLCFHPYESYQASMVKFLEGASNDPDVVSIKIALYRVSDNSKIIDALLRAADKGKLVTVLVELKARFDEHHNIEISNLLKEGGVRIVFTKPDIKAHAKVCLVTRKEKKGLRTYAHVGTGNYSEGNSKQYTDYSYFTADPEICNDLTQFFNLLTSEQGVFKSERIIYAPYNLRDEIVNQIDRQIKLAKKNKKARIVAKCNSLTDPKLADKLTEAAKAGVKIILIIRGSCILQPQKNIKIYSIVGMYLEHSRLFLFGAGDDPDIYIGSADMMVRSYDKRNELLIKIEPKMLKKRLMKHINMYLKDTVNRRKIQKDYQYTDIAPSKKEKPYNCQVEFLKEAKKLAL